MTLKFSRLGLAAILLASAAWTPALAGPGSPPPGGAGGSGGKPRPPVRSTTPGIAVTTDDGISPLYRNINPFYRNINAFWGEVNPFYRNINAFWGDIDPFYRNITPFYRNLTPFWGDLDPFYRNINPFEGAILPDYRNITPFWEATGAFWTTVTAEWDGAGTYATNPTAYAGLRDRLIELSTRSEALWGPAVTAKTGKSFADGFATPLFAKYGIDINNPASLEALPAAERSHFFLDWYDGLMGFSGTDHVDWWMKTANWTPALTQAQGGGKGTTIGLIDFFVAGDEDIRSKTVYYSGVSDVSNGHGAGVASLMVSAHDGKGIMGIAPKAKIAAYNPFDETGSADWPDIIRGIKAVTGAGASVVNLSLGVPGWTLSPDWKTVFADPGVAAVRDKTVYVVSAGNDGVTQTQNVTWGKEGTSIILVGSVDPTGTISEFSNRPGEACFVETDDKRCQVKLKERFVVAPGELLLVSDDAGGVVRRSGTSFAAPLVSGAIALLHDRWPWLKSFPAETSKIILDSAKDLGAKGVDPVYGAGLLDVTASQSPLDFNKLTYFQVYGFIPVPIGSSAIKQGGVPASWETLGLYFAAFEKIGKTQRDFMIPLSSRLVGLSAPTGERFQDYIYSRMVDWMKTGKFTDLGIASAPVQNGLGLNLTMRAGSVNPAALRFRRSGAPFQSAFQLSSPSGALALTVGQGDGAIALGRQDGFGLFSDYDSRSGGVNPILGFASGGAYASAAVAVSPVVTVSLGTSQRRRSRDADLRGIDGVLERLAYAGLDNYRADAAHVTIGYKLSPALTVQASYTNLSEAGLLGVRSLDRNDLSGGTRSDATTIGAELRLTGDLTVSASATSAQTRSRNDSAALTTSGNGLTSSAYQLALTKRSILGKTDSLRFSIAQPLTVERGTVDFKSVQVVDRETGALGVVTQRVGVASTNRRYVAETIYGLGLLDGRSEISAFGRAQIGDDGGQSGEAKLLVGGRWSLNF